jgi:hypothetical protein
MLSAITGAIKDTVIFSKTDTNPSLAHKLNISTTAVSKSVARGAELAEKEGYKLI